jgi:hypothetical protein
MAHKPARRSRGESATSANKADDPQFISIGRWYRKLYGATRELRQIEAAAFRKEVTERRERWRAEYGEELPTNVDQWERLLSRVGLKREDICDVMAGIPDIDLVINHVEGYLDRVRRDTPRPILRESDDYRPATWFRKGMADRLRKAASKSRKTKRVRTKKDDGVVLYRVADVRNWWPDALPEEP